MPKIPEYEQGRLASSLVGTPGVDMSAARAFEQVGAGFHGVADAIWGAGNSLLADARAEAHRKQTELRALQKQIETENRNVEVGKHVQTADISLTELDNKVRGEHQWDTSGSAQAFNVEAQKISEAAIANIQDPLTKLEVQKGIQSKVAGYTKGLSDWAQQRRLPIAEANLQQTAGALSVSLNNGDLAYDTVRGKLSEYDKNGQAYQYMYGAAAPERIRKDKEIAVKNYLADVAQKHPEQLDAVINGFDDVLDAKDKQAFYSQVKAIANDEERKRKFDEMTMKQGKKLEATLEILKSSPTGDEKDADPAVIREVQKKYGQFLDPDDTVRLEKQARQAATESAKKVAALDEKQRDIKSVEQLGRYARRLDEWETIIQNTYKKRQASKDKTQMASLDKQLMEQINRYNEEYKAASALQGNIKDRDAKGVAQNYHLDSAKQFKGIIDFLQKEPVQNKKLQIANSILSKVPVPTVYSDGRRQSLMSYYYRFYFREEMGRTNSQRLKQLYTDPAEQKKFQNMLKQKAVQQVEKLNRI